MEVGVYKSILTRQLGMAWNEISTEEESQGAEIACQDNADRRCCRNSIPRVCS